MNNSPIVVSCPVCGQTAQSASALYQLTTYTKNERAYNSSGDQYNQQIVHQGYVAEKLPPPTMPTNSCGGCVWFLLFAAMGAGIVALLVVNVPALQHPQGLYILLCIVLPILLCIVLPIALPEVMEKRKLNSNEYKMLEKKIEQRAQVYHTLYVCTVGTHPVYVWSENNRQMIVHLERAKELYS